MIRTPFAMEPLVQNITPIYKTFYSVESVEALRALTPAERVFAFFMQKAALYGARVALFQECPFPHLVDAVGKAVLKKEADPELLTQLEQWWMYLVTNYGVHCKRESTQNKRVPLDFGYDKITPEALAGLNIKLSPEETRYLFDKTYQPTSSVSGDIEASGNAFYPRGYTQAEYNAVSADSKLCLTAYHTPKGTRFYSAKDVCATEFQHVIQWLERAATHADQHPDCFDKHTGESLRLLISHFETGDEEFFKAHSREWLQMCNPKVEYTMGLIEYYDDPMGHVGTFQADVTVKAMDMSSLVKLLPSFEAQFPFPDAYKRKDMTKLPNAASAHKITGTGGLGPILSTIAYCLPNYDDMRSELGSKQVMYTWPKPEDTMRYEWIYCNDDVKRIMHEHSPDHALATAVGALTTTLHETIGHASGALIEGVTSGTRNERFPKWGNGIEEMRAEILALYTAITFYDQIAASGFLGDWCDKVPREDMFRLMILDIAGSGWARWRGLPSTEISQAHALADTGIMHYLMDHGGAELVRITIEVDGSPMDVLRLNVTDLSRCIELIGELALKVQRMASECNVEEVTEFMNTYATSTRNPEYGGIVTRMRDVYKHGVLGLVQLFPQMRLSDDQTDVIIEDPTSPLSHFQWMTSHV